MKVFLFGIIFMIVSFAATAQGQGGKAEPRPIKFAPGTNSAVLTGSLSSSTEAEYSFSARAGQTITLKMLPKGTFDYRVFEPATGFDTEYDSSPTLSFELPETADYVLFIRKKVSKSRARVKYTLTVKID